MGRTDNRFRMGDIRNVYRSSVGKPLGKHPFSRLKAEDTINKKRGNVHS